MRSTTKYLFFFAILLVWQVSAASAQSEKSCYEIKYSDFFYLDSIKPAWPDEELKKLLASTDISFETGRFLIPAIVYQLAQYHSSCGSKADERAQNLQRLYYKLRPTLARKPASENLDAEIDNIHQDYRRLAEDPKTLAGMFYTMDDGPLIGREVKHSAKIKVAKTIKTDFGKIDVGTKKGEIYLTGIDSGGKVLWRRLMTGVGPDRPLKNLDFAENPVEKLSLATIINMVAEGERLRVFLKDDGQFMFYYHSW